MIYFTLILFIMFILWILFHVYRKVYKRKKLYHKHYIFHHNQNYKFHWGWLSFTYETSTWNDYFNNIIPELFFSKFFYKLYCFYFRFSLMFTLVIIPYVFYIFSKPLFQLFTWLFISKNFESNKPSTNDIIIIMPGVSAPFHHFIYFLVAIIISSFIHELGHALCANRYRQRIDAIGCSVYFFIPMIFVRFELNNSTKNAAFLWKKLQIFTAALLNNATLCLLAFLLMFVNPFSILYSTLNDGFIVTSVAKTLSASGSTGLQIGDIIRKVNGQNIDAVSEWLTILREIHTTSKGFCITEKMLSEKYLEMTLCKTDFNCESTLKESYLSFLIQTQNLNSGLLECSWNADLNQTLLLNSNVRDYFKKFFFDKPGNAIIESHIQKCLPVRKVVQNAIDICNNNEDCFDTFYGRSVCVQPIDFESSQTKLIVLSRDNDPQPYIFWGHPAVLAQFIRVTNQQPRLGIIPFWLFDEWQIQLKYILMISMSLLFFNLIPCYPFDGYHIFDVLTFLLLHDYVGEKTRLHILYAFNVLSIILIISSIAISMFFSSNIFAFL